MTLPEFLTDEQIEAALRIYEAHKGTGRVAGLIASQVIEPILPAINAKLGQDNNAGYLAYMCEYVFSQLPPRNLHERN